VAHQALRQLSESDLIWISRFADRLRLRSPHMASDGAGTEADDAARSAFENPAVRALDPETAADQWCDASRRIQGRSGATAR